MLALADWSDDNGRCFPSMSAIASKVRLSRSQSQRVVHALIDAGWLTVEGNETGGPPGASRRYRIATERLTGRMHATGSADATGCTHAQDGSHPCAKTGSTHATQTVIEPSKNRQREMRSAKGSRLPANWSLPDDWKTWALQTRPDWAAEQCSKAAETFADYWRAKPGKDGVKADWLATWRNWVRRERVDSSKQHQRFNSVDYGQGGEL